MDSRNELRDFLVSRRSKITPEQAKLPAYGGNRRVEGLRREEVAMLAGVSVDYYTKLERGAVGQVSESVLDAVARALQLTAAERNHLFDLTARPYPPVPHNDPPALSSGRRCRGSSTDFRTPPPSSARPRET